MRRLLRLLFSRYGIVGIIVLLVVGVLSVNRLANGPGDGDGASLSGEGSALPDSEHPPDDGVAHSDGADASVPPPSLAPGAEDVLSVARAFAENWAAPAKPAEQWHADLRPLSTERLTEQLTGVDPIQVPTDRLIGDFRLSFQRGALAEVTVSAVGGTLRLSLTVANGRWLVGGIDWKRG